YRLEAVSLPPLRRTVLSCASRFLVVWLSGNANRSAACADEERMSGDCNGSRSGSLQIYDTWVATPGRVDNPAYPGERLSSGLIRGLSSGLTWRDPRMGP